jgi:acetyltransferase-like isoleucine patch superfamily enzyme
MGLINPTIPEKYRTVHKAPVIFEPMSGLGTNVVVMSGVTLGEGSVVGANSLVTKSTEPWTIYYGNPAKPVKARKKDVIMRYIAELGYEGEVHS